MLRVDANTARRDSELELSVWKFSGVEDWRWAIVYEFVPKAEQDLAVA